jgi:endonuclease/exonuclease/phosphatase family metal-dependent hydrolase
MLPLLLAVRVVTYNVHFGAPVARLAEALRGADIVLLQEVQDHPGEGKSRAERIAAELGMQASYAPARTLKDRGTHGLAVLSRWPMHDPEVLELPRMNLVIAANPTLRVGAQATERRIALAVTIDTPDGPLRIYDVHLDTRIDVKDRIEQLRPVAVRAQGESSPVIIGGDFNTNPFAWAARLIPTAPADQPGAIDRFMRAAGFATPTAGCGPTTPPPLEMRLDAIYVRHLRAAMMHVDRDAHASDHFPLWLEVTPTN